MTDLRSSLDDANALERRGDLAAALREVEAALHDSPARLELLRYAGTLSCRLGAFGDGAAYLERALGVDPADTNVRIDLAMALAAGGRGDEALQICSQAPGSADEAALKRLEGQILQAMGRNSEAAAAYERSLELAPQDWESWNNLGGVRWAEGDVAAAVAAFRRAESIRPDLLPVQVNLGSVLAATGAHDEALDVYQRALAIAPGDPGLVITTAKLLRETRQYDRALEFLSNAPHEPDVELERARNFAAIRRLEDSERAFRSAIRGRRGFVEAFLELGIVLERAGRVEQLAPLLDQAAGEGVNSESLAYLTALLLDSQGRHAEALEWARRAPPALEPVRIQRLISRLADREGQTRLAFAAAIEANRLAAEEVPSAVEQAGNFRAFVAALRDTATPQWLAQVAAGASAGDRPAPVFLVGFPRSATTLLDTILTGHPSLHVVAEIPLLESVLAEAGDIARLPDLNDLEAERLRKLYFSGLDSQSPPPQGAIVIDNLPLNILGTPLIHRLFPDARFIFALRHPCDVTLSCFMRGFELNDAMANFLDIHTTAHLYDLILSFWQRCRDGLPLRVHELRYEAMLDDPEGSVRPLVEFLELPWDARMLDQRRSAIERGVIYDHARGRWTRYREQLGPVLPTLRPWALRFGYEDIEA